MWKLNLVGLTEREKVIVNYLLDDYIDLMKADLSNIELTIQNIPLRPYPQTCPKRLNAGQREDYIIYLCHKPDYWCQMIYQLAHELGHFFTDCYPEKENLRWISECLCELFSIIFLNRSISFFHAFAPSYVSSVKEYIDSHLKEKLSYSTLSCAELVSQKLTELETDPTEDSVSGRPRNCFIAAKFFEALGFNGKGVSAVCLFKEFDCVTSSKEFFEHWLNKCRSEEENYFVEVIKRVVGF